MKRIEIGTVVRINMELVKLRSWKQESGYGHQLSEWKRESPFGRHARDTGRVQYGWIVGDTVKFDGIRQWGGAEIGWTFRKKGKTHLVYRIRFHRRGVEHFVLPEDVVIVGRGICPQREWKAREIY